MTVAGPWSVKGIDPKAKELAKDLARRSGMTLGEWLNQMIIEGVGEPEAPSFEEPVRDMPERRRLLDDLYNEATRRTPNREREPLPREPETRGAYARDARRESYAEPAPRRDDAELPRITRALDALSSRVEAGEHRSTLAISGIDQSVMGVLSRMDDLDREQTSVAARFEGALHEVRDTQARVADRVRRMEQDDGSSSEALKALESALGRLATHLQEGGARADAASEHARQELETLADRINRVEAAARAGGARAEAATDKAREELTALDRRINRVETSAADGGEAARADMDRTCSELETLARRLGKVETEGGFEIRADVERARGELETLGRRMNRVEAATESAPNVYAAAGQTREELDGLVRRVTRVEAAADAAPQTYADADQTREDLESFGRRVARVESAVEDGPIAYAGAEQTRDDLDGLHRRVAKVEASAEAAPAAYAGAAQTREELESVSRRLARVETATDAAPAAYADAEKVETVLLRMAERLERAEARTTSAVQSLESSFAGLDARIRTTEARVSRDGQIGAEFDRRFQSLAAELSQKVEASRADLAQKLRTAADGRLDSVETTLHDLAGQVEEAEKRSFQAIDRMGREVVSIAQTLGERASASETRAAAAVEQIGGEMARVVEALSQRVAETETHTKAAVEHVGGEMTRIAQTLGDRLADTETRAAAAVEHMGGEMTRIAEAMEGRLQRADTAQAAALEKLGGEIARIAERLTERLSNSDRRSAEALDEVTEKVGALSQSLDRRHEQASSELSDRIRQSEERTAKLLDEARERLDRTVAESQRRAEELIAQHQPPPPPMAHPAPAAEAGRSPAPNADPFAPPLEDPAPADMEAEPRSSAPNLQTHSFEAPASQHAVFEDAPFESMADDEPASQSAAQKGPDSDAPPTGGQDFESFAFEEAAFEDVHSQVRPEVSPFDPSDHFEVFSPEPDERFGPAPPSSAVSSLENEPEAAAIVAAAAEPKGFSVRDFQAPPPLEQATQTSTRDMLENARAAARRAAGGRESNPPGSAPIPALETLPSSGGPKPFGITFPGRRKKEAGGPTLRTVILASGWAAAITTAAIGAYHISHDGTGGHAVAEPQLAQTGGEHASAPSASPSELAVALSPSLGAERTAQTADAQTADAQTGAVQSGGTQAPADAAANKTDTPESSPTTVQTSRSLYDNAVQRIEAGDLTGVTSLRRAANLGFGPAQFYLGRLYEAGGGGLTKDLTEARRWTERAAQSGEPAAMYNLASYLYSGEGGTKDASAAAGWFHRAADRGVVNSQYNLAQLYEKGYGVPKNAAEAYKWYLVAAAAGDSEAKASAEALRRRLTPQVQTAAERSAAVLHTQAQGAGRTATLAASADAQPAITSAQSAAMTDH